MSIGWEIRLLGGFEIRADDVLLPAVESARARSLLSYLLLHVESATPRARLAAALWPESTEAQARTNLRHVLHTVRRVLPDVEGRLAATSNTLGWRPDPADRLDVAEFRRLSRITGPDRPAALRQAARVYRAELLDGLDDEWIRAERDRLRAGLIDVLQEIVDAPTAGDAAGPVPEAERLVALDPLRESSYRSVMGMHAARGERAAAIRVFHRCCEILDRELDVRPSAETEAAYRALLPDVVSDRPATAGRRTPLVGRRAERAALAESWRSARNGEPRLVVLAGDPGVGKSRLAADFGTWAARQAAVVAAASCYAAEGPLPYGVVTSWLRARTIAPVIPRLDAERRRDLARLLPELLVDDPDLTPPIPLPEDEQRPRVFDAVVAATDTAATASGAPVVLMIDDLQHADRESCRLVHYLLRVRAPGRLLVVATARRDDLDGAPAAELLSAGRRRGRLTRIDVGGLDLGDVRELVERMTGDPVADDALRRLHDRTGGIPLFVVEAVRAGWSADSARVPVTPRVQAVLESRIAGLDPTGRELAAAAAVIGRPFPVDLLFAVARPDGTATDDLVTGLDELWRRGIVADREAGRYDVTHEALRDVALAGTGPALRSVLHRRVARLLAGSRGVTAPGAAEVAAHHAAGGEPVEAARWYRLAATSAQSLHAHAEAIRLLDRAVQAVRAADDADAIELELRTAQLGSLVPEYGYAAPVVATVQQRAATLTESVGVPASAPLLRSLAMTALTADDFVAARSFGARLLLAADDDETGVLRVEADVLLGFAAFWSADFSTARACFERAIARYRPANTTAHLAGYGQDPKAVALARLANTRWFTGDPAGARHARDAALDWSSRLRHPFTRAAVLLFAALLDLDLVDDADLRLRVEELTAIDPLPPPLRLSATALAGLLAELDGRPDDGLPQIRRVVAENRGGPGAPGMRAILGRIELAACLATGDPRLTADAATALLATGPGARVWAPLADRFRTLP